MFITLIIGFWFISMMLLKKLRKCFFWFTLLVTFAGGGYCGWSFYTIRDDYLKKNCVNPSDTTNCSDTYAFALLVRNNNF